MTAVRMPAVAGSFYPAVPADLEHMLTRLLAAAAPSAGAPIPKALIAPHAGYVYSGPVAATAYARLVPARGRVTRVVLVGPSHRVAFRGLAVDSADAWRTPLGTVPLDRPALDGLVRDGLVSVLDAAHAQEHSLEVHVPFLQAALGSFHLIPVVAGDASADEVARVLDALWGGDETAVVISTDLSHFLDYETCKRVDAVTVAAIERLDGAALGRDSACGRVPVGGMLLAARRRDMTIATLDVRNSGDTAGSPDRVVGYGSWALFEPDRPDALGRVLTTLARASIEAGLASGRPKAVPPDLPPDLADTLRAPGAVFVTLKHGEALRGCIGSPMAWRPLVEDVLDNAFKAAFHDSRFPPLARAELPGITLSVSLLTPPEPMSVSSRDDLLAQLRPGVDGLIIQDQGRRALFLPSVWEVLPDKGQFLAHLVAKAGLPPGHWSPGFTASRFHAKEIKE